MALPDYVLAAQAVQPVTQDPALRASWTQDPRPDRAEDSPLWAKLLSAAYDLDGKETEGLFQALHALRCVGGQLKAGSGGLRLGPRDEPQLAEMTAAEYPAYRKRWLVSHADALRRLLTRTAQ